MPYHEAKGKGNVAMDGILTCKHVGGVNDYFF
jgi:hypothetical protein